MNERERVLAEVEVLLLARRFRRLYEAVSQPVCAAHGLTQTELDILGFFSNHPERDTARDVAEWRMLPKANVSQAVETLIGKGLLVRQPDEIDRRHVHLLLTEKTARMLPDIHASRKKLSDIMTGDFTAEESAVYLSLQRRIDDNARNYLERKESNA